MLSALNAEPLEPCSPNSSMHPTTKSLQGFTQNCTLKQSGIIELLGEWFSSNRSSALYWIRARSWLLGQLFMVDEGALKKPQSATNGSLHSTPRHEVDPNATLHSDLCVCL